MPLETGTYINSLVPTNPASTDGIDKADDHLRLLKSTLLATFPSLTGPVTLSQDRLNAGAVPTGIIVLWSGSVASVPSGWQLCNGTNGTPDLRSRFVVGAGSSYAVGATGGATSDSITTSSSGSHSHTTGAEGNHNHSGSTGSHSLTIAEMPAHKHIDGFGENSNTGRYGTATGIVSAADYDMTGSNTTTGAYTSTEGGGGSHNHSIPNSGTHTHSVDTTGAHTHTATVDTIPPYYALAYIMRL